MTKANGGTAVKPEASESRNGQASDRHPDLGVSTDGTGRRALRTVVAVGYVPVAVTEQLVARSQPLAYYAGVATLAAAGLIDWPVAGVVAAGVWVARHYPCG
jgi:hypothetical protein